MRTRSDAVGRKGGSSEREVYHVVKGGQKRGIRKGRGDCANKVFTWRGSQQTSKHRENIRNPFPTAGALVKKPSVPSRVEMGSKHRSFQSKLKAQIAD